jgi:plasmid replication initiation protein
MKNEVVKYHNDLNTVTMRKWTAEEMNFFFSIIAKVRDEGTQEIEFNTDEIQLIANFDKRNPKRWVDTMTNTADKISQLTYIERTTEKISVMTLFSRFDIFPKERKVIVQVSPNFDYMVNRISANFTSYELHEFTQIRSTYAKSVYRLLKQWRTIGKKEFDINEFKRLLDTPEYYGPSEIDKNILKPVSRELTQYFKNLKIKKVKANTRGTPVTGYIFTWQPEKTEKWINNKYQKRKTKELPDWFGKEYADEQEIDTETNDALKKRLENLKNKRPKINK